ncbi:hypothetical protein JW826_00685 [Candidatus Woesearchaeota archaeon]|nr:hypothetical protein [Candidatus Woesearchaeota archaeon]
MPKYRKKHIRRTNEEGQAEPSHPHHALKHEFMPDKEFFMRIERPVLFRRNLLEASKSTLGVLKGLYTLKELRHRKLGKLSELNREIKEIRLLIQKIEEYLPHYAKHETAKYFPALDLEPRTRRKERKEEEPAPSPKRKESPAPERARSEIERLTVKLEDVEDKMENITNTKVKEEREEPKEELREEKHAMPKRQTKELGREIGDTLKSIHKKLKDL